MAVDPVRAKSLFLAASELADPANRAAYLSRECGVDVELRERVEALLRANDAAPLPPVVAATLDSEHGQPQTEDFGDPTAQAGVVIAGKYALVEAIGEGGMGSVWRAKQTEPVKRFVAVKLIKAGMDSRQVLARFEAERQALALMDHPHIAKVLDGGLHDRRPYFVMELVKGVPITEYCDSQKLTPQQRLELFVPVCQAIQHAHQKGIIHRDIKPRNVLVALYDDRPVVKVIDFGVAKATGGELTERTIDTGFGSVVGTPEYMSPEQATFNNLDIDTRSDVYALGVLLYELLAGSPPFSKRDLEKKGLLEMLRVVREEEPPRPSTKLSTAAALPSLSANRGTEPTKLTGLLRNELDWIVMKALEKDRAQRYETANGFAADVQRYLSGEAVQAHPPSTAYRLKKFVRRNRPQVIAASLVFLALLAGVIGTTVGLVQANHAAAAERRAAQREAEERKKAVAAKVEAQAKEAEANAVVKFFEEQVFAAARPKGQAGGLGSAVTLRDAIVASEPALDKGFAQQPLVEARLRIALGATFYYLAEHDQSRIQYERARVLYVQNRGPDHPDTLASITNLANSYAALNRLTEALKLREEVLAIQKRVLPKDHPATVASMANLATSYADLNRPAEALKLNEEVLAIEKRVLPPDHPNILGTLTNVAISYAALNRPAEALKLREEVLAIQKRVLPPNHPDTLRSMLNLANSFAELNRPAEALTMREEVLAIQKRVLPPDHPDTLVNTNDLAISYAILNRQADAYQLFEEVLAIQKRVLPKDHPETLRSMTNLAQSLTALNRWAEALKLHEEVLAIKQRVLPKDHSSTLFSTVNLARSYVALNRHAEALPLVNEVLAKTDRPEVDPQIKQSAIGVRLQCYQRANDAVGCRTSAEMWEKLNRPDAESLYNAACYRAVTAAVQARAQGTDAARLAQADADKAMLWLTKAVAAGFKEVDHMKNDADLDALRDREDFQNLQSGLEVNPNK